MLAYTNVCLRKRLRILLVLAAAGVGGLLVIDYQDSRRDGGQHLAELLPVLSEQVAAQAQSWQWTQTIGESTHIEVRADDFSQNADGRGANLRGVALRIFHLSNATFDRVESAAMQLLDSGSLYSDGETAMTLGVPVDGGGTPVRVQASGVLFHLEENRISTDRDLRYEFEGGMGRSRGAAYDAGAGVLGLHADAYLERFGFGPQTPPTKIWAGRMRYAEQAGRIELADGARIEQGARWLECDRAVVWLEAGRISRLEAERALGGEGAEGRSVRYAADRLEAQFAANGAIERLRGLGGAEFESASSDRCMTVAGGVVDLHYVQTQARGDSELRSVEAAEAAVARIDAGPDGLTSLTTERLALHLGPGSVGFERVETLRRGRVEQRSTAESASVLEAGRIELKFAAGDRIKAIVGEGAARFELPGPNGSATLRTRSELLQASVSPATGEIRSVRQAGDFRFEEGARRGAAREAHLEMAGDAVELIGEARADGQGASVSARRILVGRAGGRLRASGDVSLLLGGPGRAGSDGPQLGLFAPGEPVFGAADALVSDPAGVVDLRGAARLWQGTQRIDANSISVDQRGRAIVALGGVAMAWSEAAEDGGGDVAVRAATMRYGDAERIADFGGDVDFHRGDMRVVADRLQAALGPVGQGAHLGPMIATGAVQLAIAGGPGGIRGFSDRLEYRSAAGEILLTGLPARLVGADGEETHGASLTYRTAGDRLLVSGHGAERAYSYRPGAR